MDVVNLKAYAKINLCLDVLRSREDGYHDVRMIMQTIGLHDKLMIKRTISPTILVNCNIPYMTNNEQNLVYVAARMFIDKYNVNGGVYINLDKKIPISAGLAGGSSDAATTLVGLNMIYGTNACISELQKIGKMIGADVPYCLLRGTAISEGIGERLTALSPVPSCYCLVVKPSFTISTKYMYENLVLDDKTMHPNVDLVIEAINEYDLDKIAKSMDNIFERVISKEHPEINEIKTQMLELGALGAVMSGSGPTVFGLFNDKNKARKAYYQFKISEYGRQTYLTDFFQPKRKKKLNVT